jgi:hypothetical protein
LAILHLASLGGHAWRQTLDRDQHVYDVTIDVRAPNLVYATGFDSSAWRSAGRGEHWNRIRGFNFKWGHRDPRPAQSIHDLHHDFWR